MVWVVHRKLLETQEEKQKACDRMSVELVLLPGWLVDLFESLHFAPRLFPSSSDRHNCTSSNEEEVNQQWEETGWNGEVAGSSWTGFIGAPSPKTNNILTWGRTAATSVSYLIVQKSVGEWIQNISYLLEFLSWNITHKK